MTDTIPDVRPDMRCSLYRAAKHLDIPLTTVYRWADNGLLAVVEVRGKLVTTGRDIRRAWQIKNGYV